MRDSVERLVIDGAAHLSPVSISGNSERPRQLSQEPALLLAEQTLPPERRHHPAVGRQLWGGSGQGR